MRRSLFSSNHFSLQGFSFSCRVSARTKTNTYWVYITRNTFLSELFCCIDQYHCVFLNMSLLMGDILHEFSDWRLGRLKANWLSTSHWIELITLAYWVSTLWFIIGATWHVYILFCTKTHWSLARLSIDWFHTWLLVCCRIKLRCRGFRSDSLTGSLCGLCSVSLCVAIDNMSREIISCRMVTWLFYNFER